jgi:DNA (cytosine-5)-methyltransferase 1
MNYLSICSGIESATVAWHPLGWEPVAFAEIDPFCNALLSHRYPHVPNLGDFTRVGKDDVSGFSLLVGGTPCQSFSVAGKRAGLDDPRGVLAIEFLRLAQRTKPRWILWENVPGVLSSWSDETINQDGTIWQTNDFDTFISYLQQCGYRGFWRILDAQYFGVPQRRRRVFVVGYFGDWRPAATVLFERESMCGYPAPRREKGQGVADRIAACLNSGGDNGGFRTEPGEHLVPYNIIGGGQKGKNHAYQTEVSGCLQHKGLAATGEEAGTLIAYGGNNTSGPIEIVTARNATHTASGRMDFESETFIVHENKSASLSENQTARALRSGASHSYQFAGFYPTNRQPEFGIYEDVSPSLKVGSGGQSGNPVGILDGMSVRRLTPREAERLQGFPDDYTLVPYRGKPAADGPRYKALGNSKAVPVVRWIGERIEMVEGILR